MASRARRARRHPMRERTRSASSRESESAVTALPPRPRPHRRPRDDGAGADQRAGADPHPAEDDRARAERRAPLDDRRSQLPVLVGLQAAVRGVARGRLSLMNITPWPTNTSSSIVDAVADEGVTLDLAARADRRAALDLDERPDPGPVADAAAVEVRERLDDDVLAELDVARSAGRGPRCRLSQPRRRTPSTAVDDRRDLLLGDAREDRQRQQLVARAPRRPGTRRAA